MSAQKALQGPLTKKLELLEGMEENKIQSMNLYIQQKANRVKFSQCPDL